MKKNMISKTLTALVLVALTALFSNCSTEDNAVERSYDVQILGVKDNAASLELGQTLKLIVITNNFCCAQNTCSFLNIRISNNNGFV